MLATLASQGYVQGENLVLEQRWSEEGAAPLAALAAQLVRIPVDVIVTWGTPRPSSCAPTG